MPRNDTSKPATENGDRGPGITERVTGTMKRAAGAVGRAARGAVGRPEAGTDELFLALHSDHEEVSQLFEKLLATTEKPRAQELWTRVSVALLTHARAEQEIVYERLANDEELSEDADHAVEEHEDIEDLLLEANVLEPGTEEFQSKVAELEQTVRHHVDDEEGDLLPKAAKRVSEEEREQLVAQFRDRKDQLEPRILVELTGGASADRQRAPRAARRPTGRPQRRPLASGRAELEGQTVRELQALARKRGIEGRSRMKKKELVAALARA